MSHHANIQCVIHMHIFCVLYLRIIFLKGSRSLIYLLFIYLWKAKFFFIYSYTTLQKLHSCFFLSFIPVSILKFYKKNCIMSAIRRELVSAVLEKAIISINYNTYNNIHKRHEFKKQ